MLEDSMVEGMIISVTKESKNTDLYRRLINEQMPIGFYQSGFTGFGSKSGNN